MTTNTPTPPADDIVARLEDEARYYVDTLEIGATAQLMAAAATALRQRDATINECMRRLGEEAKARGEAEGQLQASELAGVVQGWQERTEAAEARATGLQRRLDEALGVLGQIEQCADAYPVSALPEPDFDLLHGVLRSAGIPVQSPSASNILKGVGKIARDARTVIRKEGES